MNGPRKALRYVTTGDVGKACGVTPTTVKKWIRQGKVLAILTPGGHFRIPIGEIARLRRPVSASATAVKR